MNLSIVTTMYCSAPYIEEFYRRVSSAAQKIADDYEIIFVNDGSPDDSLDIAIALHERDPRVKVIDLSRNFGHHKAIMTGLSYAQGDLIFLLDSDLEEEPELLLEFNNEILKSKADVVYGVQRIRKGSVFKKITGYLFYYIFNLLSDYPIPSNLITARIMSKRYVNSLIQHRDRELFLGGILAITGFKQISVEVNKKEKGTTSYNLKRKFDLFINAITSFTSKPLIIISYIGMIIFLLTLIVSLYILVRKIIFNDIFTGWTSLILSVWLLGGLIIFCIGIVGIYISKIFMETKNRPYTIVKQIFD